MTIPANYAHLPQFHIIETEKLMQKPIVRDGIVKDNQKKAETTKFEAMRGARILVERCLNLQPGEEFLVVTDTNKLGIAQLIAGSGMEREAKVSLTVMPPLPAPGMEPPRPVAAAMKASDAIVMPTTYTITQSHAREEAQKSGARILSLGSVDEGLLASEFYQVDYLRQKPVVDKVAAMLTNARKARLTTSLGSALEISIEKREAFAISNVCHERGTFGCPPNIEASIAPLEDTASGELFVDGSTTLAEIGILTEPIRIKIENGTAVEIKGGAQASILKNKLDSYDDPNIFRVGELGIGLNPMATRVVGIPLVDEGVLGTAHIGLGQNITYHGKIVAKTHIDLIITNVTLELDHTPVLKNGKLQV